MTNRVESVVGVLPVGMDADLTVRVIASNINAHLDLTTDISAPRALPAEALDPTRGQYDAGILMRLLSGTAPGQYQKILAVCSGDLFVPIVTHVYGEAQQGGRVAVVSLHRLSSRDGSTAPLLERAVKIALHEVGHLFDLTHCRDPGCLMHFSSTLAELDATPVFFLPLLSSIFQNGGASLARVRPSGTGPPALSIPVWECFRKYRRPVHRR